MASGTTSVTVTNWLVSSVVLTTALSFVSVALTAVLFFVSEKQATIVNMQMAMAAV